jgi:capsular exopolysaccharide synthesis family protein
MIIDGIDGLNRELNAQKERLVASLRDAILGKFNVQTAEMVEYARPGKGPSGRMGLLEILWVAFLSFGAMCFLIGLLAVWDRRVGRAQDFKLFDGFSFLGYIPEVRGLRTSIRNKKMSSVTVTQFRENTFLADHVHELCNDMVLAMPVNRNKVIAFTGILPKEGKTTVSCLSALALANLGQKVLLVDVDLRAPGIHENLAIDNDKGLADYLKGERPWKASLKKVEGGGALDVLTAGAATKNAPALLASAAMERFLNEVRETYDRIILDLPPMMYIPDAFIIGKRVDGMVLVFRASNVSVNLAREYHARALSQGLPILGGCINHMDIRWQTPFRNYLKAYGKYYGSTRVARASASPELP